MSIVHLPTCPMCKRMMRQDEALRAGNNGKSPAVAGPFPMRDLHRPGRAAHARAHGVRFSDEAKGEAPAA
jgi:hypothetical protein